MCSPRGAVAAISTPGTRRGRFEERQSSRLRVRVTFCLAEALWTSRETSRWPCPDHRIGQRCHNWPRAPSGGSCSGSSACTKPAGISPNERRNCGRGVPHQVEGARPRSAWRPIDAGNRVRPIRVVQSRRWRAALPVIFLKKPQEGSDACPRLQGMRESSAPACRRAWG